MLESVAQANACNNARIAAYNSGTIRYYAGTKPASVAAGIGGATLLATNTFGATAFPSSANRVLTANSITGANAVSTGTIGFAAAFASDGTTIVSIHSVGTSGSGAECIVNSTSCTAGIAVNTTSFTITQPDGA
jgi:hypothetical protein